MKVAIVTVPFFTSDLHLALAQNTMDSIVTCHEIDRIAIVNRSRPDPIEQRWLRQSFDLIEFREKNILSAAWNRGIKLAFERGADYALIVNLDLTFHPACIDNLVSLAQSRKDALIWSAIDWPDSNTLKVAELSDSILEAVHYSCFMIDQRLLESVGEFDEVFEPAYYEDADMNYRLSLAGYRGISSHRALFNHYRLGTFKGQGMNQEQIGKAIEEIIATNDYRYLQKWGGTPGKEVFKVPYNRK